MKRPLKPLNLIIHYKICEWSDKDSPLKHYYVVVKTLGGKTSILLDIKQSLHVEEEISSDTFNIFVVRKESIFPSYEKAEHLESTNKQLIDALKSAKQYIENGIDLGYIIEPDSTDPALEVLPKIIQALRNERKMVKMKFKDAPVGARFKFPDDETIWVKINAYPKSPLEDGGGLIVQWNGNVEGRQSFCSFVDENEGIDFNTVVELV